MKNNTDKWFKTQMSYANSLKSDGVKISRGNILKGHRNFLKHNQEALSEGYREQKVLKMKRYYKKRGWDFPPKSHKIKTICDLINGYYEKEVTKHTPRDELEKIILGDE